MTEQRKSLYELTQDEIDLMAELSEEDDPEKMAALIAVQMQSDEKIVRMVRIIEELELWAVICKAAYDATKNIISRRKAEADMAANQVKQIKGLIVQHMSMQGVEEKTAGHYRLRLRNNPMGLKVASDAPMHKWDDGLVNTTYTADRKEILDHIKNGGQPPPGVEVVQTARLVINTEKGANGDE